MKYNEIIFWLANSYMLSSFIMMSITFIFAYLNASKSILISIDYYSEAFLELIFIIILGNIIIILYLINMAQRKYIIKENKK